MYSTSEDGSAIIPPQLKNVILGQWLACTFVYSKESRPLLLMVDSWFLSADHELRPEM